MLYAIIDPCGLCFDKTKFYAWRRAPEPSDVYWENLHVGLCTRYIRLVIANLLTVVLVIACFVGISLLKKIQKNGLITLKEEAEQFQLEQLTKEESGIDTGKVSVEEKMNNIMAASGPKIISILCSGVVVLVNALLLNVVRRFALFEKNHTQTSMNVSVAFKLTIARFINSSLVLVYANWDGDWFKQGSLVYDATILTLSLAFSYPITYLLGIGSWVKSFKRIIQFLDPARITSLLLL